MERVPRWLLAALVSACLPVEVFSQESFGRVDIRALRTSNLVSFRAADTNVAIGYAAWRRENPRSMIVAQKQVSTNWSAVTFQFAVQQDDSVTLILRGRYREPSTTTNAASEWVWADNVSVIVSNNVDLCRNGSFEKTHGFLGLTRDGQPEKWGYKGPNREIRKDKRFAQDGAHCLRVRHDVAAFHNLRARSNVWYTVQAYFRAD